MNDIIKRSENINEGLDLIVNEFRDIQHVKIPFNDIATLGSTFTPLVSSFKQNEQMFPGGGVYRVSLPKGIQGTLAEASDGSGFRGFVMGDNGIKAHAVLHEVGSADVSTMVTYNPAMLFISAAIISIDHKLDDIKRLQQDTIDILERDKKSQLRADMDLLIEISGNYKYEWDNDSLVSVNLSQVKSIKRNALKDIYSYMEEVERLLDDGKEESITKRTGQVNRIFNRFVHYKLGLYVYTMSSLFEIILSRNFNGEYIRNILAGLEEYSYQYRVLYTRCYDCIEFLMKSSVISKVTGGIAHINRTAGMAVGKIPIINKSQININMLKNSERLEKKEYEKNMRVMERFMVYKDSGIQALIDNIESINIIYNEPIELYCDRENIYLAKI